MVPFQGQHHPSQFYRLNLYAILSIALDVTLFQSSAYKKIVNKLSLIQHRGSMAVLSLTLTYSELDFANSAGSIKLMIPYHAISVEFRFASIGYNPIALHFTIPLTTAKSPLRVKLPLHVDVYLA